MACSRPYAKRGPSPEGEKRYPNGTSDLPNTFSFTGQIQESSLGGADGLYYYRARWYDSYLNRWTQPDIIVPEAAQGVQAWDRYCFVSNNPIRYIDPTGKYGVDVHYYMTYNLVYTAVSRIGAERGWSEAQIKQVAGSMAEKVGQADMFVDHEKVVHGADGDSIENINKSEQDLPKVTRADDSDFYNDAHKMEFEPALDLAENAKDLDSLGEALHSLQDVFSHRMKPNLDGAWAGRVALNHTFTNDDIDAYHYPVNVAPDTYGTWDELCDYSMYYWTQAEINNYLDEKDWSSYDHKR